MGFASLYPSCVASLLPACAGQLDRNVRRGADDLRAAIGVGRAPLGNAPDRLQKQKILFGEHGVSSSAMASPLVWRDSGDALGCHVAGLPFQDALGVP